MPGKPLIVVISQTHKTSSQVSHIGPNVTLALPTKLESPDTVLSTMWRRNQKTSLNHVVKIKHRLKSFTSLCCFLLTVLYFYVTRSLVLISKPQVVHVHKKKLLSKSTLNVLLYLLIAIDIQTSPQRTEISKAFIFTVKAPYFQTRKLLLC